MAPRVVVARRVPPLLPICGSARRVVRACRVVYIERCRRLGVPCARRRRLRVAVRDYSVARARVHCNGGADVTALIVPALQTHVLRLAFYGRQVPVPALEPRVELSACRVSIFSLYRVPDKILKFIVFIIGLVIKRACLCNLLYCTRADRRVSTFSLYRVPYCMLHSVGPHTEAPLFHVTATC